MVEKAKHDEDDADEQSMVVYIMQINYVLLIYGDLFKIINIV